jgi:hypothetical protein
MYVNDNTVTEPHKALATTVTPISSLVIGFKKS